MSVANASLELWLRTGSTEHRERAIEEHRYLCARAARKFIRDGIDRSDLEQVAAIGLIKAVDRFDVAQGTPFDGYAWVLILGELMHYVRDHERVVRVPRRIRELDRKCAEAERELTVLLGRDPSEAEVADVVGIGPKERGDVRRYRSSASVSSFDALPAFEQRFLAYTMECQIDRIAIDDGMKRLLPVEREILREIYERGTPVVAVAERLGYSRRHVTRLHRSALQKLSPFARPH